jgi:RNA exonuclease 4
MASGSKRYIALDVECVATGRRHDDRDVSLVAVVDINEEVILKRKVKPEKPIVSYLTPLTGLRPGDLDNGERLSVVLRDVKAILGPDVVLVGQGLKSDIKWLQLEQGKDYDSVVDLAQMFKTYNSRYGNYSYFSLSHEANTLIRAGKPTKITYL